MRYVEARLGKTKERKIKMVYKYKATQYKIPAQVAGEYLNELGEKEGGLTAETLLEASRPEEALLHDCFEWDDSLAAERFRLRQARSFIGNIVAVEIQGKPVEKTRAFVSVTETAHREKGVFVPIVTAMSDERSRETVLKNALFELQAFKEKYRTLSELAKVFEAIDELTGGAA